MAALNAGQQNKKGKHTLSADAHLLVPKLIRNRSTGVDSDRSLAISTGLERIRSQFFALTGSGIGVAKKVVT